MASQLSAKSEFTEAFAVHVALKAALKSGLLKKNPAARKAAASLCSRMESERSVYGRQLKMIGLMEKGATLAELGRKLKSSRRTIFRYLNHLEEAGIPISLENNKYVVDKSVVRMLRA